MNLARVIKQIVVMPKIKEDIEQKIKTAASIVDVIEDAGIHLRRHGAQLICSCPFHEEKTIGGFVVNERGNYCHCFGCGKGGDPIKFVMEYHGKTYQEALRYIAAMYNIYVDEEPAPKVQQHKPREPRKPMPPRQWVVWNLENMVKPYMHHAEQNPLLQWMLSLPMKEEHKRNLKHMIELYMVGTSLKGYTKGWTIWPQVDMDLRVRDMKFMAYKPDGHRDKSHNPNWMKAMLTKAGMFDDEKQEVHRCLFGLHMAKVFTDAEICLVESEKTAVLCSAFTDPNERIWMAVGGMQSFRPDMLEPLIRDKRYIVLFPDADGAERWAEMSKAIGYERMSTTGKMRTVEEGGLYNPVLDGPKADIADIMVRLMQGIEETEAEKVARRLGHPEAAETVDYMMKKLDLQLID